eukprot:5291269-Amphidinium_carterae.1
MAQERDEIIHVCQGGDDANCIPCCAQTPRNDGLVASVALPLSWTTKASLHNKHEGSKGITLEVAYKTETSISEYTLPILFKFAFLLVAS